MDFEFDEVEDTPQYIYKKVCNGCSFSSYRNIDKCVRCGAKSFSNVDDFVNVAAVNDSNRDIVERLRDLAAHIEIQVQEFDRGWEKTWGEEDSELEVQSPLDMTDYKYLRSWLEC